MSDDAATVRKVLLYLDQYAPESYVGVRDLALPALESLCARIGVMSAYDTVRESIMRLHLAAHLESSDADQERDDALAALKTLRLESARLWEGHEAIIAHVPEGFISPMDDDDSAAYRAISRAALTTPGLGPP
jgi:hypothetical protein